MVRILPAPREKAKAGAFLAFIALALMLCFPYSEGIRNANELPRLVQGMALWETGAWSIDGPVRRRLDVGPDVSRSPEGRLYPNKPPGASLLCAAAYGLARGAHGEALDLRQYTWWARLLTGVLPAWGLALYLAVRLTRAFGRAAALAATALTLLATPLLAYGHLAYGHVLAAMLLTVGVTGCLEEVTFPGGGRVLRAAGYGCIAAAAVAVEYGAVFAGMPLAVALLASLRVRGRWMVVLGAVVGSVLPMVALGLYHQEAFGSPWATGYHHVVDAGFAEKHGRGLLGLESPSLEKAWVHLFSPRHGLLWWAPLVPAALYGLATASTHRDEPLRTVARVWLAIFVTYLVLVCSLAFDGGWRVGPRYLVVALPGLAWGLAEFVTQIHHRARWIVVTVAVATYALVINAWAANLWPHIDDQNIHHPVAEVLWPLWQAGVEPYGLLQTWGRMEGLRGCVALTVVGGLWVFARALEPMPRTIAAFVLGVVAGVGALGAVVQWPPHPRGRLNLEYIQRVWEPRPGLEVAPSVPLRPLSANALEGARRGPSSRASVRRTRP